MTIKLDPGLRRDDIKVQFNLGLFLQIKTFSTMGTSTKLKIISFKNQKEFDQVNRQGKKTVGRYFVLVYQAPAEGFAEPVVYLGLKASKKIGNAVTRNKVRRRLKHMIRDFVKAGDGKYFGARFLIVPKHNIISAVYADLVGEIKSSLRANAKQSSHIPVA